MSDNIPFDLQIEIMHKLPVKSLLQFRCVSKRWKSTTDFSDFIRRYGFRETDMCCFNLTYMQMSAGFMFSVDDNLAFTPLQTNLNLPTLKPIATSEGVWCFSWGSDMCLVIWNPSIKKSVGKLVPYLTNQPDHPKMVFGFGVHPDTLDPTLLKINYSFNVQGPWYVSVFTLSSNRWINLENDRLPRQSIKLKRYGQAVVGGKIFWVGSEIFYSNDGSLQKSYMLVSFDLVTHHFHVVDIPREIRFMIPPPFYISQLGTSLIISRSFIQDERKYMSAWVLEFVGVILTSFEVLFTIPFPIDHVVKLLGFSKNVEPIVETKSSQQTAQLLQVYYRTTQEFQNMGIEANDGSFFIGPYKESLILHSLANE